VVAVVQHILEELLELVVRVEVALVLIQVDQLAVMVQQILVAVVAVVQALPQDPLTLAVEVALV
jgi:hypothetical protein